MLRALLKCLKCGHTWSCRAWEEPDLNVFGVNEDDPDAAQCPECGCEEYDIIGSERETE